MFVNSCRRQIKTGKNAYNTSMYELTISAPNEYGALLAYIKNSTAGALVEMDGIATDIKSKRRSYYSVACSDTFRFQLKRLMTETVAESVALGYKNMYVRSCLHVSHATFFQNVLINTMCVFDKAYDRQIIAKIIDTDKPLFIDGYCNFRLNMLKRKWSEIAKLVCENNYILRDKQLILEFLQYLLESIESKISQLSVTLEENTFMLYDENNNLMPAAQSLAQQTSVEEEAALNILLLKPKHLTIYSAEKPSEEFCELMQMFDCKFVAVK